MAGLLTRLRRYTCPHAEKRVWDVRRDPDGAFRLLAYCPRCGTRWEARQAPEEYIRAKAGDAEMADTMRRNLNAGEPGADENTEGAARLAD